MTSEKKIWARTCYLINRGLSPKSLVYQSERVFSGYTGKSSEELIKKYPLTKEAVLWIEKAYQELTGENVTFDQEEYEELGL